VSGADTFPLENIHFPDHHGEADTLARKAADEIPSGWECDNVELTTVGVDIGSSTSHLLFSRLHLQRLAQSLSSRFVVVGRETVHRSAILLTPYADNNRIDVRALQEFVKRCYAEACLGPEQVDTGAVILTGVALERSNARAVAELFAGEGGGFVCASAGHNLEAILAAHGSGAVARSRSAPGPRVHVDIGGGTTKLALLENGEILATAALAIGGRVIAWDAEGRVDRIETSAHAVAEDLGVEVRLGGRLPQAAGQTIVARMARILMQAMRGEPPGALGQRLQLTDPLGHPAGGTALPLTCSGGVAEYIYGRQRRAFNDLGADLAQAFRGECLHNSVPIDELPGGEGIRATAIGASQFTVQLSGNTVFISNPALLPLRNLPVVRPRIPAGAPNEAAVAGAIEHALRRLDLGDSTAAPVAVALPWSGAPSYARLRALADGLVVGLQGWLDSAQPLVVALESDIGRAVGHILAEECGVETGIVCIDGVELKELDYVDIGKLVHPANVVPVVVKSLAFGAAGIGVSH